ncbi:MAG: aminoglycoside phosphotransferase family protein [Candidatus Thorarchaeota archaeon]
MRNKSLGGWTHINILGYQNEHQFAVKFPALKGGYESNPFEYQFQIIEQLYREQICPEPIMIGNLSDANGTPFMVTRFVHGKTHSSVTTFSQDEINQLFKTLDTLNKLKLRNTLAFNSPSDMIDYFLSFLHLENERSRKLPILLRNLIRQNEEMMTKLYPAIDAVNWVVKLIHGDLTESNIVFSDNKAVLLDFEACCFGSPVFDIAYLYNQVPNMESLEYPEFLKSSIYSEPDYNEMIPLVLASVITWTITRLIELELRNVEHNFDNIETKKLLYAYLSEKSKLLSAVV